MINCPDAFAARAVASVTDGVKSRDYQGCHETVHDDIKGTVESSRETLNCF
jgi:hypothetical protein